MQIKLYRMRMLFCRRGHRWFPGLLCRRCKGFCILGVGALDVFPLFVGCFRVVSCPGHGVGFGVSPANTV